MARDKHPPNRGGPSRVVDLGKVRKEREHWADMEETVEEIKEEDDDPERTARKIEGLAKEAEEKSGES